LPDPRANQTLSKGGKRAQASAPAPPKLRVQPKRERKKKFIYLGESSDVDNSEFE